ncbi:hypothetical protein D5086_024112 [Populus alba]|uniref:Uncharacterized protein n=1 Tax=Populus alba TaxID=43335 RepID=A0ACC4B533_POPAL
MTMNSFDISHINLDKFISHVMRIYIHTRPALGRWRSNITNSVVGSEHMKLEDHYTVENRKAKTVEVGYSIGTTEALTSSSD